MKLLTVNAGSSSVRLAVEDCQREGVTTDRRARINPSHTAPQELLREFLASQDFGPIDSVAHRVVHGGAKFLRPCLIDGEVEGGIERAAPLAPLHNRAALEWIRACRSVLRQGTPQVAVFDTGFFAELPAVAKTYALPRELTRHAEVRRFGFHGLAHRAMWDRWMALHPEAVSARVITLQLGSGCSIAAVHAGRPVDTSMGFSPLEGLVMATRSGDLDPGLLLYLQRSLDLTPGRLEALLSRESGLLGASGVSQDMQVLLACNDDAAKFAIDLYCYRARKYVGAYLAALGGADAIVFGGGVGENAPMVRAKILGGMDWAGIRLNAEVNLRTTGTEARISEVGGGKFNGHVEVWAIPVDESRVIAAEARAVLTDEAARNQGV